MDKRIPAAGEKGGAKPRLSTIRCPEFIILKQAELTKLLNVVHDGLATRLYMLFLNMSDFKTGEVITSYADLMSLCTPPKPEKGRPGKGPTYKQVRTSIEQLITVDLVKRNADKNEAQGMLRLYVRKRKTTRTN